MPSIWHEVNKLVIDLVDNPEYGIEPRKEINYVDILCCQNSLGYKSGGPG